VLKNGKKRSTVWAAGGVPDVPQPLRNHMWAWLTGRSEGESPRNSAAITSLETRMDALERSFRTMRLEWEDVYDRLMKAAARLNARTRREAAVENLPTPNEAEQPQAAAGTLGTHDMLAAQRNRRGKP